jgi:5-hydroxyisourate hydrolase
METSEKIQLNTPAERLALYQRQISSSVQTTQRHTMARDPITCHVLNTLTGTPAANLPCTLTLLSGGTHSFKATTDSDGRIKAWETSANNATTTTASILGALPAADSKTNWSIRFDVGPWFEAQGIESFWPEVEVKFTVRGRGVEGKDGWRHYHVPVLLGPWSYSTYRGS